MQFQTITEHDIVLDEIEHDNLRVRIKRLGAEMVSLAQKKSNKWMGFLYRDNEIAPPASGWSSHATVMGYFLHRLWHEQSMYRGHVIRGGNHGFIRHFLFSEPRHLEDGLVYHIPANAVPKEAYPFRVSLDLSYRIIKGALHVGFDFTNHEPDQDVHLSFGLHPGFAVHSISTTRIIFPPGIYKRFMAPENFLNGCVETIKFDGGEMPFKKSELSGSFLLGLEGVQKRQFMIEDPVNGTCVTLDFSEAPYATLWSDADNFICIEPCWGLPDSNPPVSFEQKIGIQRISPMETLHRSFSIKTELTP